MASTPYISSLSNRMSIPVEKKPQILINNCLIWLPRVTKILETLLMEYAQQVHFSFCKPPLRCVKFPFWSKCVTLPLARNLQHKLIEFQRRKVLYTIFFLLFSPCGFLMVLLLLLLQKEKTCSEDNGMCNLKPGSVVCQQVVNYSGRENPRRYLESTPDSRSRATRPVRATCRRHGSSDERLTGMHIITIAKYN